MEKNVHYISADTITLKDIEEILHSNKKLALSDDAIKRIVTCREYLDQKMKNQDGPVYGINTGFGSLCDTKINDEDLEKLQENLVKSHACGTGDLVPIEIVRLMLLLKVQGLSYGYSGVQLETVERLIFFYNEGLFPVIYTQGSLGASGDLAPLAHMCLPLLGMGEFHQEGKIVQAQTILSTYQLSPIKLKSKEGLALLNGTQFMSAYGVWCLLHAHALNKTADLVAAVSLEAFDGRNEPFTEGLHTIRPHKGQLATSKNMRLYLSGSEMQQQIKKAVQDPYSFRCVPQVHGASKDTTAYVTSVFETEINSVTDNPTILMEEDRIVSGGNFHGQPLAIALDMLCIAMSELSNISERRTYQLISGLRGLPAFLVKKPGLNSGYMIPQYTAASIVSANKQLCTPASADSIVSSNGQEDHVSMGANAAVKCFKVIENSIRVSSIELLNAAQALEFRRPLKSSAIIEQLFAEYRKQVHFVEDDVVMYEYMHASERFVKEKFFKF
jgi:histidine ammonia-lyase